jgi:hypothetical protein
VYRDGLNYYFKIKSAKEWSADALKVHNELEVNSQSEYRTAEQGNAESRSNHFDILRFISKAASSVTTNPELRKKAPKPTN